LTSLLVKHCSIAAPSTHSGQSVQPPPSGDRLWPLLSLGASLGPAAGHKSRLNTQRSEHVSLLFAFLSWWDCGVHAGCAFRSLAPVSIHTLVRNTFGQHGLCFSVQGEFPATLLVPSSLDDLSLNLTSYMQPCCPSLRSRRD